MSSPPPADEDEVDAAKLGLGGGWLDRFLSTGSTYVLTRFLMLRWLGLVYLAAFLTTALQARAMIGPRGLLPAQGVVDFMISERGTAFQAARQSPSLFLWTGASDGAISAVSWIGVALSVALALGVTNAALMALLWVLYLSIVNVGGLFYGYGWEIQLLETGLLTAFLCPIASVRPFPKTPPPIVSIWLSRWLIVRIMLGAGLIKLRGDECWRDLTCLHHHYETQPIPGPLSPYFHRMPGFIHSLGVLFNHLVEVLAPLFAFGPRLGRRIAGVAFIVFQITLILSGNLSFLNWLTVVPAIACFDDEDLRRVLPKRLVAYAESRATERTPSKASLWTSGAYALVVAILSINPIANLFSPRQAMNRSFDPLHVVNTYGAFGSVGRVRYEVIVQGSEVEEPFDDADWKEYELPCKPGPLDRSLCWISPYHRRLDWQMWFLQFDEADRNPWFIHFVAKLLSGDPVIRGELSKDPFEGRAPRWVRAELFEYRFARGGPVWERKRIGNYLRPVERNDAFLDAYLRAAGFERIATEEPKPPPVTHPADEILPEDVVP